MGRIYDEDLYPITEPDVNDIIIYSDVSNGNKTVTTTLGAFVTLISNSKSFVDNISPAVSSYQDDRFIGKELRQIWVDNAGANAYTAGLVSGFNSTTGTITFNFPIQGITQFAILP